MRVVLVLTLAVVGALVGLLVTRLQPGHQPWPLVGLVAGTLLGLWLAATILPRRRR
jgi:F0F1-type ATP synthase assembly protein I